MRDPYEVLGVAKSASAKDIKAAYRKLAKKHHPDQNPDDAKAKDRFAQANQAYEILGDEKNRAAFDRGEIDAEGKPRFQGFEGFHPGTGASGDPFAGFRRQQAGPGGQRFEFRSGGGDPFSGGDAGDIFSELFGQAFAQRGGAQGAGGPRQAPPGRDINVTLDITVEEAATAPKVTAQFPDGRKIAVKLPAFVEDGQTIRLKGQGEQGMGKPGDALVKIRLRKHPRYRVEGRDLHVDLPVPLKDAVLGAKLAVETPTGRIAVTVPAWSSSDKVLRLKGRGLTEKAGGHGDLYVHVRVMLPEGGDAELETLMRHR
ncbi:DnaJ C-terminal domain-containing protein [Mesorhizobium sp. ZMM04-5]|uniref:DnaJ C-terminal domain-containing protein n=1 Tax=Mesorhizobium marinum TaxID=3228790 RepID=A0ABV3R116_9HYPH